MLVPLTAIVVRERPDPVKGERFARMLRSGLRAPPIRVMRYPDAASGNDVRRWYLFDGHHRVAAAKAEGVAYIRAVVVSLAT